MKKMYIVPAVGVVFVGMTNALLAGSNTGGDLGPGTGHGGGFHSKQDEFDEWESYEDEEDVGE